MIEKKRIVMVAMMMAVLVISTASCTSVPLGKNTAHVETESGWTIEEDGSYTYACVITNTSEEKIVASSVVSVDGLDADGNVMKKLPEWEGAGELVGPIMPGEKAAVVEDRRSSSDPMNRAWEATPEAFSFKAGISKTLGSQEEAAKKIPNIQIVSAEQTYYEDDAMEYEVVLENKGDENYDVDLTGAGGYVLHIRAVFRDEDGNITGGGEGVLQNNEDVISFPAGEELVYRVYFDDIPKGEPELILTWN